MKKSQIKFGESIGVIIVVYVVILIGLLWYNNINSNTLEDMFERDERQRAFEKYQYINDLDLIHISENGIIDDDFDLHAIRVMSNFSKTKEGSSLLRKELGESYVSVDIYNYEIGDDNLTIEETIVIYNFTNNNLKRGKVIYKTLIPIYDIIEEEYIIGLLNVEVPLS